MLDKRLGRPDKSCPPRSDLKPRRWRIENARACRGRPNPAARSRSRAQALSLDGPFRAHFCMRPPSVPRIFRRRIFSPQRDDREGTRCGVDTLVYGAAGTNHHGVLALGTVQQLPRRSS